MDEGRIKDAVRSRYSKVAKGSGCGCSCGSSCCGDSAPAVNPLVDYGDLAKEMVEGTDLGLGCGMPTLKAGIKEGDTVLDLGSGAGADAFIAAKQVGPSGKVIGVDMTEEMVTKARYNARKSGFQNVDFRLGEIENLPVADASVDVVISNCVINLVPDKRKVFAEIFRVLKPGGFFSISDMVTYGNVPQELREDMTLWAGCIAGALDKEEYLETVRAAGFHNLKVTSFVEYDYLKTETYGIASMTLKAEKL